MSELTAGASSHARRWRDWLVGYLLVQAAIVVACLFLLRLPLPAPPEDYRLAEATLGGDEQAVHLPYHVLSPAAAGFAGVHHAVRSTSQCARPGLVGAGARFINAVEVAVNGADILDSRRHPAANRPDRNTPEIVAVPAVLLRDGSNLLTIRLHMWGPLSGFLDSVYVGPDEALRPAYETRALLFLALPVVFAAWQAILAVLLGVMWLKRRHEPAYGILAAAMALGVLRAFATAPVTHHYAGAMILIASTTQNCRVVVFVVAFLGMKLPRYIWLVFVPVSSRASDCSCSGLGTTCLLPAHDGAVVACLVGPGRLQR